MHYIPLLPYFLCRNISPHGVKIAIDREVMSLLSKIIMLNGRGIH